MWESMIRVMRRKVDQRGIKQQIILGRYQTVDNISKIKLENIYIKADNNTTHIWSPNTLYYEECSPLH